MALFSGLAADVIERIAGSISESINKARQLEMEWKKFLYENADGELKKQLIKEWAQVAIAKSDVEEGWNKFWSRFGN